MLQIQLPIFPSSSTPITNELKNLPPHQQVAQPRGGRKHFLDTFKLIAYRAETAIVQLAC